MQIDWSGTTFSYSFSEISVQSESAARYFESGLWSKVVFLHTDYPCIFGSNAPLAKKCRPAPAQPTQCNGMHWCGGGAIMAAKYFFWRTWKGGFPILKLMVFLNGSWKFRRILYFILARKANCLPFVFCFKPRESTADQISSRAPLSEDLGHSFLRILTTWMVFA